MYYYDTNDRRPKRWALGATAAYAAAAALLLWLGGFDVASEHTLEGEILIEFVEEEPEQPVRPHIPAPEAQRHETFSEQENNEQVHGSDEQTRTVNPDALFKMNKSGVDEAENTGNARAEQGDEHTASGRGHGLNADGNDQLDKGLQGRGLRGSLPKPVYNGNRSGKVVVRVTVDRAGNVSTAEYEPKGSTSSDDVLVQAAIAAARRAKFTESAAFVQGGTITYVFRMN